MLIILQSPLKCHPLEAFFETAMISTWISIQSTYQTVFDVFLYLFLLSNQIINYRREVFNFWVQYSREHNIYDQLLLKVTLNSGFKIFIDIANFLKKFNTLDEIPQRSQYF